MLKIFPFYELILLLGLGYLFQTYHLFVTVNFSQNNNKQVPLHLLEISISRVISIYHIYTHDKYIYGKLCVYIYINTYTLSVKAPSPNHWTTKEFPLFTVQSLSHARLSVTPWTAAHQASLSFTVSQSLLRLMSIESIMPFQPSHPVAHFSSSPQSFPASGSFPMSWLFASGDQSIGASGSSPSKEYSGLIFCRID